MRDRELHQSFERFRRHGDTAALAEVFDRTAPGLLRVGRYLTGSRSEAEDVLQATFLTAIERRAAFDATRPLEPWLFGILVKHAAAARRRSVRLPEAARFDPEQRPREPREIVEERELAAAIDAALKTLPPVYREVLEPRLREGSRGAEIARRVGRPPSVVRSQIHRGLALLKAALPRGLVASGLLLVSRPSFAAVRRAVLRHGADAAGSGSAVAAASLGGLLVGKKVWLAGALAIALCGTSWWFFGDAAPVPVAPDASVADVRAPFPAGPQPEVARVAAGGGGVSAPVAPATAGVPAVEPPSYARHLAGVRGRLLEANGAPVAHTPLVLLEAYPGALIADVTIAFQREAVAPRLQADATTTAADGSFHLDGAHGRGLHALGVDLGGPRAALRLLDVALAPGEVRDLGDVVLPPVVGVTGRVVDEEGEPVAGARVRCAPLPVPIAPFQVQHYRRGGAVLQDGREVHEVPAWIDDWYERLPIPTDRTDLDGRFRLTGVSPGLLTLIVDAPGLLATTRRLPSGRGGVRDAGEITLEPGGTVTCHVVDAEQNPVPGADVLLAILPLSGPVSVAVRAAATDDLGQSSVGALPGDARFVLAARANPLQPWTCSAPFRMGDPARVTLPEARPFDVVVEDEQGAPVDDVELRLWPGRGSAVEDALTQWRTPTAPGPAARSVGAGRYRFEALAPADYVVIAGKDGYAPATLSIRSSAADEATLTLRRGRVIEVLVVADGSGAPVEHAQVLVTGTRSFMSDAQARTDADGVARLGPCPPADQLAAEGRRLRVGAAHPAHPTTYVEVAPDADRIEVRLPAGGSMHGRVVAVDPAFPVGPCMVVLQPHGVGPDQEDLPWLVAPDSRGEFVVVNLAPGAYRYEVYPRFGAEDPFAIPLERIVDPEPLAHGRVAIQAGETVELTIPIVPPGSNLACTVRGSVRCDGVPLKGARITLEDNRRRNDEADSQGRFAFEDVAPGRVVLSVNHFTQSGTLFTSARLYQQTLELQPGEAKQLSIDVKALPLRVRVLRDRSGTPLAKFNVFAYGADEANAGTMGVGVTNDEGLAEAKVHMPGTYEVCVYAKEQGVARGEARADGATVDLLLDPGVRCAGSFTVPPGFAGAQEEHAFLSIAYDGGRAWRSIPLTAGTTTFDVKGLPPGTYGFRYQVGVLASRLIDVVIPPGGRSDYALGFEPQD